MYRFSFIMALLSLTFWICSGPYFYRLLGSKALAFLTVYRPGWIQITWPLAAFLIAPRVRFL